MAERGFMSVSCIVLLEVTWATYKQQLKKKKHVAVLLKGITCVLYSVK